MMLGQRYTSIEVKCVDHEQDLCEHMLGSFVEFPDVITVPEHDHQIGHCFQPGLLTKGFQQGNDVLALIGSGERQDHRFAGIG